MNKYKNKKKLNLFNMGIWVNSIWAKHTQKCIKYAGSHKVTLKYK